MRDEQPLYKEWKVGLREFLAGEESPPPAILSAAIRTAIEKRLNPSAWFVFARLSFVVFLSCIFSLSVCPQFGLGFTHHFGLKAIFMEGLGPFGCEIACGAFFSIIGVALAALVLQREELKVLRATRFIQIMALSALFLGGFVCSGSEALSSAMLLWLLGAVAGGLVTFEAGYMIRFSLLGTATA